MEACDVKTRCNGPVGLPGMIQGYSMVMNYMFLALLSASAIVLCRQ